jgi:cytochrome c oxidase subunit 2
MATDPTTIRNEPTGVNHVRRVLVAWIAVSVVATPLVAAFVGPILPPGKMSTQASEQVFDNTVMTSIVTPIVALVFVYFIYALIYFRAQKGGALVDGPPLREHSGIQVAWVAITSVTVLFLAAFGTYQLLQNGSGGGQGPSPVAVPDPAGNKLTVQVIGQQWQFTYRYPSLGGLESKDLVLPENTLVTLHVTSIDVIHSFWAYQLGVKADANPGADNIAYVHTKGPGTFQVRCAELCGLFHGYMFNTGRVVSAAQFHSWARTAEALYKPIAKYVPPYATTYVCPALLTSATCSPQPTLRGG